jgi:hypothetical protein
METSTAKAASKVDEPGRRIGFEACSFGADAGHGKVLVHESGVPANRG